MTPATAALLARVRAESGELEAEGGQIKWRAPNQLPEDLIESLRDRKAELLSHLRDVASSQPADALTQLHGRLRCARDWRDLLAVLSDADMAYVRGDVTGDDIDRLCDLARQESQNLPEHVAPPE